MASKLPLSKQRRVEVKELLTNAVILCTDTDNEIQFHRGHRYEPLSHILGTPNITPLHNLNHLILLPRKEESEVVFTAHPSCSV